MPKEPQVLLQAVLPQATAWVQGIWGPEALFLALSSTLIYVIRYIMLTTRDVNLFVTNIRADRYVCTAREPTWRRGKHTILTASTETLSSSCWVVHQAGPISGPMLGQRTLDLTRRSELGHGLWAP